MHTKPSHERKRKRAVKELRGVAESSRPGEEGRGHRDYASYLAPALGKGLVGDDEVRVPEPETEPEA